METADKNADQIVKIFLKYFVVGGSILIVFISIANIIYCLLTVGYVDIDQLYMPCKIT